MRIECRIAKAAFALAVFLFVVSGTCYGSLYYIDYKGGNDGFDGSTPQSAWRHCPGDGKAEKNAGRARLAPGDRVLFKGGTSYTGSIEVRWSGTKEKPIVYDGNWDGTWGTGRAVINNQNNVSLPAGFFSRSARNHITIKHFEFTEIGGYESWPPRGDYNCSKPAPNRKGIGIDFFSGGSGLQILDSYFHEIGEWHNTAPAEENTLTGSGIALQNTSDVVIDGCEFTRVRIPIQIKAGPDGTISGVEVKRCNIYGYVNWGIDIAVRGIRATVANISIHDNRVHDYTEYDKGVWQGCGEKPHTDGIFLRRDYPFATYRDIRIYNNRFFTTKEDGGGTASIHVAGGPSALIYNNTFVNTRHGRTIFVNGRPDAGSPPQQVGIYNNTFYNGFTAIGLFKAGSVRIKNNIFFDTRAGRRAIQAIAVEEPDSAPTELDYNHYFPLDADRYILKHHGWLTLEQVRAKYGWEMHGQKGDPLFLKATGIGEADQADLRLKPRSPCRGKGINLQDLFDDDMSGRKRGAEWSMGAYN